MEFNIVPQVNFKLSDMQSYKVKFLTFNLGSEKDPYFVIRQEPWLLAEHYDINLKFIEEIKPFGFVVTEKGGGLLCKENGKLIVESASISFGEERDRNSTITLLRDAFPEVEIWVNVQGIKFKPSVKSDSG